MEKLNGKTVHLMETIQKSEPWVQWKSITVYRSSHRNYQQDPGNDGKTEQ